MGAYSHTSAPGPGGWVDAAHRPEHDAARRLDVELVQRQDPHTAASAIRQGNAVGMGAAVAQPSAAAREQAERAVAARVASMVGARQQQQQQQQQQQYAASSQGMPAGSAMAALRASRDSAPSAAFVGNGDYCQEWRERRRRRWRAAEQVERVDDAAEQLGRLDGESSACLPDRSEWRRLAPGRHARQRGEPSRGGERGAARRAASDAGGADAQLASRPTAAGGARERARQGEQGAVGRGRRLAERRR